MITLDAVVSEAAHLFFYRVCVSKQMASVSLSSPSSIVDMNTMAVALMQQNNLAEATESFRRALFCLRELVGTAEAAPVTVTTAPGNKIQNHGSVPEFVGSSTSSMETAEAMQTTADQATEHEATAQTNVNTSTTTTNVVYSVSIDHPLNSPKINYLSTSPDNLFEFYNRAFVISSDAPNVDKEVYESIITAVVLYNMGLSCHRKAGRSGATRELHSALKLYEMSAKVIQDVPKLSRDSVNVLVLALINNMGYIHSHFYDYTAIEQCRAFLYSLFMSSNTNDLTPEDCVFFSYVLLRNDMSPMSPAA
jgi:hypothetical protein